MKVYVFGNEDTTKDNKPLLFLDKLQKDFVDINFVKVKPNEDLPFDVGSVIYILDTIEGINEIKILDESAIDKLSCNANTSVHDYDLGFQLKYLKKLGKINKISILGLPMNVNVTYDSVHSNFKKFVAQDIQGS